MSKAERTFDLKKGLMSLFHLGEKKPAYHHADHVDPALISFARLGLLAYYTNPL